MTAMYTYVNTQLSPPQTDDRTLRASLERGTDDDKIVAMNQILRMTIAGDSQPQLLMDIIRYVLPSKNKRLKKLMHAYWECVPKHDQDGKLKQEMILVVNAVRNELQHPNEYIRGSCLRFLSKFREPELLDPLIPTIRQCLEHRYAYVRKNAILCLFGIAQYEGTKQLIPDADEMLYNLLQAESDGTCLHNAFVALTTLNKALSYEYFHSKYTEFASFEESLQLAFVEFASSDALDKPELADVYTQLLRNWVTLPVSLVVSYELATGLAKLAQDEATLIEVANIYISVAVKETDNNVKITALNRISAMVKDDNLSSVVMDVLLVLPTPDLAVRQAALTLALKLVSTKTVDQVLRLLKKELSNSFAQVLDMAEEYRFTIIDTIREIAKRFKDTAPSAVTLMLEFIPELDRKSAITVLDFVKETIEVHPDLRTVVLDKLVQNLHSIRSSSAFHPALWAIGEYATTEPLITSAWEELMIGIGDVPFNSNTSQQQENQQQSQEQNQPHVSTKPKLNADGTYAQESPLEAAAAAEAAKQLNEMHQLRQYIVSGNTFLAGALSATLAKLVIRFKQVSKDVKTCNQMKAKAMLVMAALMRTDAVSVNDDAFDRIYGSLNVLVEGSAEEQQKFLDLPLEVYRDLLQYDADIRSAESAASTEQQATKIEAPVSFRLFNNIHHPPPVVKRASNVISTKNQSQLKQVTQLTGYSDGVYSEALMTISQFDILFDVLMFNQTEETLQNLRVEFFTSGALKVVDTPPACNLAPYSFHTCKVIIRVSSADAGSIFGNISYNIKKENKIVLMNIIRPNVIDYIQPAKCPAEEFREKWVLFEWENKVSVKSAKVKSLAKYLELFMRETHMGLVNPGVDAGESKFLSANLYARSCFGEDALVNLSIELDDDGTVQGHARIRTEERGPAVSIGQRINHFTF